DPQQRLLLEEAWHCIEDSGIPLARLREESTAVFVGAMGSDYLQVAAAAGAVPDSYSTLGTIHGLLANRLSFTFGLKGPSLAVDAAHASSLVALHEARTYLLSSQARYALAAGVNLSLRPEKYVSFSKAGMLSGTGRCRTFDQDADGCVPGEGVAVVLLQPLEDALACGHRIYGVIAGSAVNHGGQARSLTVPQAEAQERVIRAAFEDAGFGPETVTFVETHGTGTPLGDGVEVEALARVFGPGERPAPCLLGAVKTHIGHLEACSGLAGVVKVLLMMQHRTIPANLHLRQIKSSLPLNAGQLRPATQNTPWESPLPNRELRAGVSSFGIGGTNVHVLLTSHATTPDPEPEEPAKERPTYHPFLLSARTPQSLERLRQSWRAFLDEETVVPRLRRRPLDDRDLREICATLASARLALPCRLGAVVCSLEEIRRLLDDTPGSTQVSEAAPQALHGAVERWLQGEEVDWQVFFPPGSFRPAGLPLYPFERRRHWITAELEEEGDEEARPASGLKSSSVAPATVPQPDTVVGWLRGQLVRLTDLSAEDVGEQDSFIEEHGVDSFVNQEWLAVLESRLGKLPKTLLFELTTLADLARYLMERKGPELAHQLGEAGGTASRKESKEARAEASVALPASPPEETSLPRSGRPGGGDGAVAVIGLAGRFPGARNIRELWRNLESGLVSTGEVPPERWDWRLFYDEDDQRSDKAYTRWGGFIEGYDRFDPLFFKISPLQAELMDPQQRLFLENAWACLEDAGYRRGGLPKKTGVFAGLTTNTYALAAMEESARGNVQIPDTDAYDVANRVSYFFDFHGPSMTVDTACSSSLTAIHLAIQSLRRGECEVALAGGVSLTLHPYRVVQFCSKGMLLAGSHEQPFGSGTGGFVDAEGVAAVLLKPLEKAVADGDHIYGVIRGSAINSGGRTGGYTVPSPVAQAELVAAALEDAGIDARTVSYVEAHGTGTILGDPIEVDGLTRAFRAHTEDRGFCALGSVKSNIG
ncbi:MAG: beta-ketoacyl synthase, partial [Acidobacteria bacterium]|nr:beta-ketoacyl synthase [Acidobacteriota bacterium]